MEVRLGSGDALVIIDMQNDFLPGGSLAVPMADTIVPVINRYLKLFHEYGLPVFATRDWHPPDHCSFQQQGGPWPPHCIATTTGAAFHPEIEFPINTQVISKATTAEKDAYSGFTDTQLHTLLQELGIRRLFVGGVATEYCVLNTVKDALQYHYTTFVLKDAICAINLKPEDGLHAQEEMERLGAALIQFEVAAAWA
ncbi:isochorismatase family protein [Nitrosomonas sp. Is37]|uniref:isochorismatase family protein n=1 Tax=Nitrosomonas sp. Is37 TaxID=3080535 RepID=UPI00294B6946|nr:isochorismatase family protein [Nitrosomonas sp. Is37]MDV6344621.1 isochorismatase family protein [Nitrosomonas sp. Is37]